MITNEQQQAIMWERNGVLAQGCHPSVYGWGNAWDNFNVVIDLDCRNGAPPTPEGSLYVQWAIDDGPMPSRETLTAMGRFIARLVSTGNRVLVHCTAGMNRSALVAAEALYCLSNGELSGDRLYTHIKRRQPMAFTNQSFRDYVQTLGATSPARLSGTR